MYVPNPTVSAIINPLNFPGRWFLQQVHRHRAPTLSKILPTDVIPTDFSTFWQGTDKVYKYTQHVRILDANRPVLLSGTTIIAPDSTGNDPDLWNEPYWNNPIDGSHDLQESSAELHLAVTDDCDASNLTLHYTVYSDFDYDGIAESANGPNQASAGQVWYNNLNGFNGELRYFDRTMPLDSFGLAKSVHGDTALFHIMLPPLPTGMHSVRWIVEDNCGNVTINTDTVNIQATTAAFEPGIGSLKVQPNPFSNKTRIYFHLAEAGVVYCSVFDVTGKLLSREADWFEGGDQIKSLGGNWPVGVYFYRLETRQGISSGKLLKKE
ncbi:MAG: T9SS type A sorting domain-containing protein [Saprospiraceae bacterium]